MKILCKLGFHWWLTDPACRQNISGYHIYCCCYVCKWCETTRSDNCILP